MQNNQQEYSNQVGGIYVSANILQVRQCCCMACEDTLEQQMNQRIMQGLGKSSIETFGDNCTLYTYL